MAAEATIVAAFESAIRRCAAEVGFADVWTERGAVDAAESIVDYLLAHGWIIAHLDDPLPENPTVREALAVILRPPRQRSKLELSTEEVSARNGFALFRALAVHHVVRVVLVTEQNRLTWLTDAGPEDRYGVLVGAATGPFVYGPTLEEALTRAAEKSPADEGPKPA